jgi:hypothetical protein
MKLSRLLTVAVSVVGIGAPLAGGATPLTLNFFKVPSNTGIDISSQLSVEVSGDANYVYFTFKNAGGSAGTIGNLYVDDGLLGPATFFSSLSSPGVTYAPMGNGQPVMPGQNNIGFQASSGFTAEPQPNINSGIGAGEYGTIGYGYTPTYPNLAAVENALTQYALNNQGYNEPSIWLGMHVQQQGRGTSDAYAHTGASGGPTVPDGGLTLALLGFALFSMETARRRFLTA